MGEETKEQKEQTRLAKLRQIWREIGFDDLGWNFGTLEELDGSSEDDMMDTWLCDNFGALEYNLEDCYQTRNNVFLSEHAKEANARYNAVVKILPEIERSATDLAYAKELFFNYRRRTDPHV